jgi:orotidine-5'-phosphate decarboxylase
VKPFGERLAAALAARSQLCVGIDPHPADLARWGLTDDPAGLLRFGEVLAQAALDGGAAAVKPQSALFERHGSAGVAALEQLLAYSRSLGLLTILDVKRGDIGSTMAAYAQAYLGVDAPLAADAVTLSPYLGFGSLKPALELAWATGRGVFVLALTSNPEAAPYQRAHTESGLTVAEEVITAATAANLSAAWAAAEADPTRPDMDKVGQTFTTRPKAGAAGHHQAPGRGTPDGEQLGSVGLVVGATIAPLSKTGARLLSQFNGPILAPGIGAQGAGPKDLRRLFGGAEKAVLATSSRGIAGAGPDPKALVQAVSEAAKSVSFLGN